MRILRLNCCGRYSRKQRLSRTLTIAPGNDVGRQRGCKETRQRQRCPENKINRCSRSSVPSSLTALKKSSNLSSNCPSKLVVRVEKVGGSGRYSRSATGGGNGGVSPADFECLRRTGGTSRLPPCGIQ